MGWHVSLTFKAAADLLEITAFIAEQSPQAATRTGLDLTALIASLDQFPYRGAKLNARSTLRRVMHDNVLVVYQIKESTRQVIIVRLWDARQNPRSFKL